MTLDRFYPVVPDADWVERLLAWGAKLVQLRIKDCPEPALRAQIERAKAVCAQAGAQLVVNDHWQLALDTACDFVHLGQEDLADADMNALRRAGIRFGISTHDHAELDRALVEAPDYVALGPIYPTQLKKMPWAPQGLARIAEWKRLIGARPLVAIGGLTVSRAELCLAAGADCVAVVGDIVRHPDPSRQASAWLAATRPDMTDRYIRQTSLAEIGAAGQGKLAAAKVLVVGAGGLGSTVLQILAGAGIGEIVIVDHDHVDLTNLHRQPLYGMDDIGVPKADAARRTLLRANPGIVVTAKSERLTPNNAAALVQEASIVIDAADNFAVTYILSDRCRAVGKPLVSASVLGLSGYVGAYCAGAPSYRAVFPDAPEMAGSCASVGVLGSAVSILGSLQAHMALHLLLDVTPSVLGRVVRFDGDTLQFGGFSFADCPEPSHAAPFIGLADLAPDDIVVDLRGVNEAPIPPRPDALRLAPTDVDQLASVHSGARIVLCCRSGQRALRAAGRLQATGRHNLALVALEGAPT